MRIEIDTSTDAGMSLGFIYAALNEDRALYHSLKKELMDGGRTMPRFHTNTRYTSEGHNPPHVMLRVMSNPDGTFDSIEHSLDKLGMKIAAIVLEKRGNEDA